MRSLAVAFLLQLFTTPILAADWELFSPEIATRACENNEKACKAFYRGIVIGFFASARHSAELAVRDPDGVASVARQSTVGEIVTKRLGFCISGAVHTDRIAEWIKVYAESPRTNSGDKTIFELIVPALAATYPCR